MGHHVRVGVPLKFVLTRYQHPTKAHPLPWPERVDVKTQAHALCPSGGSDLGCLGEVAGMRNLQVALLSFHHEDFDTIRLGNGQIVVSPCR
jgi:hypothetical protein